MCLRGRAYLTKVLQIREHWKRVLQISTDSLPQNNDGPIVLADDDTLPLIEERGGKVGKQGKVGKSRSKSCSGKAKGKKGKKGKGMCTEEAATPAEVTPAPADLDDDDGLTDGSVIPSNMDDDSLPPIVEGNPVPSGKAGSGKVGKGKAGASANVSPSANSSNVDDDSLLVDNDDNLPKGKAGIGKAKTSATNGKSGGKSTASTPANVVPSTGKSRSKGSGLLHLESDDGPSKAKSSKGTKQRI